MKEPITDYAAVKTAITEKLARYFGVSDRYFLDLQNDIDIREMKARLDGEIRKITPCREAV